MTDKELNSHDLAREIEISKLQEENEILKDNAEHNAKAVDKINWENMLLKKENQELKSQLRGTTHCFDEEEHNKLKEEIRRLKKQLEPNYYVKGLEGTLKEYQQEMNKVAIQQKEFIKYLQEDLNVEIQRESIGCEITNKRYILEEVLQKYKSIIGVSNENTIK